MALRGPLYPVGLVVADAPVLVVGGGRVAAGKVAGLTRCGAHVTVIAPDVVAELEDHDPAPGRLGIVKRRFAEPDVVGRRLVISATGDPAVDGAVYRAAADRGIWVNSADDPTHCDFTLPAIWRQGSVMVTVATEGRGPAVASWLRDRLAAHVGPEVATLVDLVAERRSELQAAGVPTEGLDWRSALDSGTLEAIADGRIDDARASLAAVRPPERST